MKAVITADIVNSTTIAPERFHRLMEQIKVIFKEDKIEIYRGDSFQVLMNNGDNALLKCVQSRLLSITYTKKERIDIRMSISLGELTSKSGQIGASMDDIFVTSGRSFDKFKDSSRRLSIVSRNAGLDFTFEIIAGYTDTLLETITPKQAEVLGHLFSGMSQVEAAKQLNKTTATISQHVKSARYYEIDNMLGKFRLLTKQL